VSSEVSSPLADIIKRASQMPAEGPAAKVKARWDDAGPDVYLLLDVSGSMRDPIGDMRMNKFDCLVAAVRDVLAYHPKIKMVAFGSWAREVRYGTGVDGHGRRAKGIVGPSDRLIGPDDGGTDLAGGLRFLLPRKPFKTIVISDGIPNSTEDALSEAEKLTGSVETIYCGPDNDPAIDFLRQLSRQTGGTQMTWNGYSELGSAVRALIG
jgi:hypothetical protein